MLLHVIFFFFRVCASESHISFTDEDASDSNGHSDKPPDPTNVTDANAYEELIETSGLFIASTSHEPMIYNMLEATEDPEQQTNQNEAGILETTSAPVVDQFPTHSAGALIPGISHGISAYECQEGPVNSVWAPFASECDWDIAHWAKMRGPTSSVVGDLLDKSKVCMSCNFDFHDANSRAKVADPLTPLYRPAH